MNKKIIIIFAIVCVGFVLLTGPAFAKENVNVKISTDKWLNGKGVILIKLVDDRGREINTNGKINYTITDSSGHYEWKYKSYSKFNQKMDDYIEDNYWDEEIYDDPSNYDGEGY